MLKYINLKKLTAKTLIGILMVGGLLTNTGTRKAFADSCDNNGHGNNNYIEITLEPSGLEVLLEKFDPSNPGNGDKIERVILDSNPGISPTDLASAKALVMSGNYDYEYKPKSGNDTDCDGINDEIEVGNNFDNPVDTDSDGIPDFVDTDSDGDGIDDDDEGTSDDDNDNIPNYLDTVDDSITSTDDSDSDSSSDSIILSGTLRDFEGYRDKNGNITSNGHEDFERKHNVDENPSGQKFKYGLDTGITTNTLGADKKPVYAGGSYSTTTKANFDQWYRDVSGVNQSMTYDIELKKEAGSNVYSFDNDGKQFFPLDGLLLGNENRNHNFHFTFEIHTKFTYQGGETFDFSGDDDVWVYIDGQKVIDIGGVHGKTDASVNLDSLGLTVGETYDLDFFFAERHVTQSNFKIETTLELETAPDPNADDDNDGISNLQEGSGESTPPDSDNDGIPDYEDDDSDNNGIPDNLEVGTFSSPSDSDNDGIPNFQDDDDDGNGILDINEIGTQVDSNGIPIPTNYDGQDLPDYQDTDDDNDGILDTIEGVSDSNGNGIPDHHEDDIDQDGIDDATEGAEDPDNDGIPNFQDPDSDNNGILDVNEGTEDPDNDGSLNFEDPDNDGDGILDVEELIADADGNGVSDIDPNNLPGNGTIDDVDGDGIPNDLDSDSDNDGYSDDFENSTSGMNPYIRNYAD